MKKIFAVILMACFMAGAAPLNAFASSVVDDIAITKNSDKDNTTVIVYGSHEWYVIDYDQAGDKLFLFCTDKIFGQKYGLQTSTNGHAYSGTAYSSGTTDYSGSTLQTKIGGIFNSDFTSLEQGQVLARDLDGTSDSQAPKDQRLWPLSKSEADSINTGLRVSLNPDHWWMRSASDGFVWFADAGGAYYAKFTYPAAGSFGIRPAFYLDTAHISIVSDAVGGKPSSESGGLTAWDMPDSNKYKLTLTDGSRVFDAKLSSSGDVAKEGGSIKIDYSGAGTGANEYVSAILADQSGKNLYYGRIVNGSASGTEQEIKMPSGLAEGSYTLKVFSEQYNGDRNTDYASALIDLPIRVDNTAPVLKAEKQVSRTKDGATVQFTSSEAGAYYYVVQEAGMPTPSVDTSQKGTPCDTSRQTLTLTKLSSKALEIYLVVKDAAGNVSQPIKISIPQYTAVSEDATDEPATVAPEPAARLEDPAEDATDKPATGDSSNMELVMALIFISLSAGLLAAAAWRMERTD